MRSLARMLAAALGLCSILASTAVAAVPFNACAGKSAFGCARLSVPLDPSGAVGGSLPLSIQRLHAKGGDGTTAVIALAGGPGQAATPLAANFAQALAPALASRDLVVFDQRGTGGSLPLDCPAFRAATARSRAAEVLRACATQIGARRGLFTTAQSVEDVEAIRRALGYNKLVLFGTSYGTKVALDYAIRYPVHVERLLLDSTVTQNGPDVFSRSTIAAVPGVIRGLCGAGDCARISSDPVADLQRLVGKLRSRTLIGSVVDPRGRRRRVAVTHDNLLDILIAGDEDPTLRAGFPGAVRAALNGDPIPLARLRVDALGDPRRPGPPSTQGVDVPLFYATECEELAYPWNRAAAPATKLAQLAAAARALNQTSLLPFDSQSALRSGTGQVCANWPQATLSAQVFAGPLPAVPTLILSGADDLRTPTADAAVVAAQIPGSKLLVVPNDGHSVLGTDVGSCSRDAVRAFFGAGAVQPCAAAPRPTILRATAVPPLTLAAVSNAGSGRPGRALAAAELTLLDARREVERGLFNALSSGLPFSRVRSGGLRGGYALFNRSGLLLHAYSYVPGVRISGLISNGRGRLTVSGRVSGRLKLRPGRPLTGTLAGKHVRQRVSGLAATATAIAPTARTAQAAPHPVWRTP